MSKVELSLSSLSASKLRWVLVGALAIVILLQVGVIVLGQQAITAYSKDVAASVSTDTSNKETLSDLQTVKGLLEEQSETVKKSQLLLADKSNPYAYQNQIISDITNYANMAGVQVTGFTFSSAAAGDGGSAEASSTPAASASSATGPAGLAPISVSVSIVPGIPYESFYEFLQLIEDNLLHMQVGSFSLSSGGGATTGGGEGAAANPNTVALSTLTIQVYSQK